MPQLKKQFISRWLKLSLTIGIVTALGFVFFTIDIRTWKTLAGIQPLYLLAAGTLVLMAWLIQSALLQSILAATEKRDCLGELDAAGVYLATFFAGGITPMATGELPAVCYLLNRYGIPVGRAGAVSFLRAALSRFALTLAGIAIFFSYPGIISNPVIAGSFTAALFLGAATSLFYLVIIIYPGLPLMLFRFISVKLGRDKTSLSRFGRLLRRLEKELIFFYSGAVSFRRHGTRGWLYFFLTALYWLMLFSVAPVLLLGMGLNPHYPFVLFWQVIIQTIITYIPLPGGSGAAELGTASLFSAIVPSYLLGVFVLAWRFFTYYLTLLAGGIAAFGLFRLE